MRGIAVPHLLDVPPGQILAVFITLGCSRVMSVLAFETRCAIQ